MLSPGTVSEYFSTLGPGVEKFKTAIQEKFILVQWLVIRCNIGPILV